MRDILIFVLIIAVAGVAMVGWSNIQTLERHSQSADKAQEERLGALIEGQQVIQLDVQRLSDTVSQLSGMVEVLEATSEQSEIAKVASGKAKENQERIIETKDVADDNPARQKINPKDLERLEGESVQEYRNRNRQKITQGAKEVQRDLEASDNPVVSELGSCVSESAENAVANDTKFGKPTALGECYSRLKQAQRGLEERWDRVCREERDTYDKNECERTEKDIKRVDHAAQMMRMMMMFAAVAAIASGNPMAAMMIMAMMNSEGGDSEHRENGTGPYDPSRTPIGKPIKPIGVGGMKFGDAMRGYSLTFDEESALVIADQSGTTLTKVDLGEHAEIGQKLSDDLTCDAVGRLPSGEWRLYCQGDWAESGFGYLEFGSGDPRISNVSGGKANYDILVRRLVNPEN